MKGRSWRVLSWCLAGLGIFTAHSADAKDTGALHLPLDLAHCLRFDPGGNTELADFHAPQAGPGALAAITFSGIADDTAIDPSRVKSQAPAAGSARVNFTWRTRAYLKLASAADAPLYHPLFVWPRENGTQALSPGCAPGTPGDAEPHATEQPFSLPVKIDLTAHDTAIETRWGNITFLNKIPILGAKDEDGLERWRLFETGAALAKPDDFDRFASLVANGLAVLWEEAAHQSTKLKMPLSARAICDLLFEAGSLNCTSGALDATLSLEEAALPALSASWNLGAPPIEFIILDDLPRLTSQTTDLDHASKIAWTERPVAETMRKGEGTAASAVQPATTTQNANATLTAKLKAAMDADRDTIQGNAAPSSATDPASSTAGEDTPDAAPAAPEQTDPTGKDAGVPTPTPRPAPSELAADDPVAEDAPASGEAPQKDVITDPRYAVRYEGLPASIRGLEIAHFPDALTCESAFPYPANYAESVVVPPRETIERMEGSAAMLIDSGVAVSPCAPAHLEGEGENATLVYTFAPLAVEGPQTAIVLSLSSRIKAERLDLPLKAAIQDLYEAVSSGTPLASVSLHIIDGDRTVRRIVAPEQAALLAVMSTQQKGAHIANLMRSFDFSVRSMSALDDLKYVYRALKPDNPARIIYVTDSSREDFDPVNSGPLFGWLHYDQVPVTIFSLGRCGQWEHLFSGVGAGLACEDMERLRFAPPARLRASLADKFLSALGKRK